MRGGASGTGRIASSAAPATAPRTGTAWRRSSRGARRERLEALGERGPRRALLVLEEDEGVAPRGADGPDRLEPAPELRVRVLDGAESEVAPARGRDRGRRAVLILHDRERRVLRAEERVDLVGEPGRVAELERRAHGRRQEREGVAETLRVQLEVRRELEEERA